ncbi:hypothetical protein FJ941_10125 [Mesorhizobium sp. B2-3-13]|uniref:hypothetical protein n=1 Tax=Mesorhizobium sp. B2-3-13 TaxID=2589951 RepID=UPI00112D7935|nr:hypothetical protein [Mesorhizobium sp. B2-3-13]TPL83624.1 hypothetical protein FJ941_10125 [Mesorhizobium sp. B2-3-13]
MSKMAQGVCKLTGSTGRFVDSHLIPKALTRAGGLGEPLVQGGIGRRPVTRHSSWYDPELVTQEGETILAKLDDWAIRALRETKLVWSGWGPTRTLTDNELIPGSEWGIRFVGNNNWRRLRVFFLSLLWRAGASTREEFSEVRLSEGDLETLRRMIVGENPDPIDYFQIQLIQLSTFGFEHNHTPIPRVKTIQGNNGEPDYEVPFYRFYFDGLIAHFDRRPLAEIQKTPLEELVLGYGERLCVSTVSYWESSQRKMLERMWQEVDKWPRKRDLPER